MAFTVIIDNKEKNPWDFSFYEKCSGTMVQHLPEGDYTIKEIMDLEESLDKKILRIERKASTSEIAGNLGRYKERFFKEMEKMSFYEHKYLILEFDLETLLKFPAGSGIPKKLWYRRNAKGKKVRRVKMTGGLMKSRLDEIEEKFGVTIIWAGSKEYATDIAVDLFEKVYNAYKEKI